MIRKGIVSILLCVVVLFTMSELTRANVLKEGIKVMSQQWGGLRKLIMTESLPYTGKGITIGVIDSGIDSTHLKLREKVMSGKGCNYVFGNLHGHGTNVAGIISEVATNGKLINYRVVDSEGEANNGDVLCALRQAIQDNAQVINLSLSLNNLDYDQLSQLKKITNQAYQKGTIIVSSAGNEGRWGNSTITLPRIVTVGASTPSVCLPVARLLGTDREILLNPLTSGMDQLFGTTAVLVDLRNGTPESFNQNLQGKVVLYHEGSYWYRNVLKRAKEEAARAVLMVNKDRGPLLYNPWEDRETMPLGMEISVEDGLFLRKQLSVMPSQHIQFLQGQASKSVMTKISSWGNPSRETIKPDLVAPGYKIVSTHPLDNYYEGIGTSYAAPMVTGAIAILKEAHPEWSSGEVVSSLCLNASPLKDDFSGKPYSPIVQGSGQLNVAQALMTETFIFPHQLHLLVSRNSPVAEKEVSVRNMSKEQKKYLLRTQEDDLAGATLSSSQSITVPAGGKGIISVKAIMNQHQQTPQNSSGRLYVTCDEQEMNIPITMAVMKE